MDTLDGMDLAAAAAQTTSGSQTAYEKVLPESDSDTEAAPLTEAVTTEGHKDRRRGRTRRNYEAGEGENQGLLQQEV